MKSYQEDTEEISESITKFISQIEAVRIEEQEKLGRPEEYLRRLDNEEKIEINENTTFWKVMVFLKLNKLRGPIIDFVGAGCMTKNGLEHENIVIVAMRADIFKNSLDIKTIDYSNIYIGYIGLRYLRLRLTVMVHLNLLLVSVES